jgi:methylated-DNA-[protein]-cysteine S-methyltransferase
MASVALLRRSPPVGQKGTDMKHERTMDSPIGILTIVAADDAIAAIWFDNEESHGGTGALEELGAGEHAVLDRAVEQLGEYFQGERTEFDLPLAPEGTLFQQQAWMALRAIPFGETITYGEQARRLGDPKKSRAVGAANGKNPIPIVVPCHRVVGANGKLTGFAGGLDKKAWLLDHEWRVRLAGG